ncbi:YqgE/AlgH family protein [Coralliovum pocilloporae]|uniref:YqgE/AlgH family protein n=1 Tax=Coralliovum pocilloporae TaxID=3066369 RepID=UPI003D9C27B0
MDDLSDSLSDDLSDELPDELSDELSGQDYLDGQFLIAMPGMTDERFARSLVYICAHSEEGAMGIIVNREAPQISFSELLDQLEITTPGEPILLPDPDEQMTVHNGGPVDGGRGFVLHSSDFYIKESTLPIDDDVCLTATLEVLKAIAHGRGPRHALLALGYAGWAPGQLETEIQANGWLNCPGDMSLLFDEALDNKYDKALAKLGIDEAFLSMEPGRA